MESLVDAALRDQERRILDASPGEIDASPWKTCRNCGHKLRGNNRIGFCQTNKQCAVLAQRERRAQKG
jgi:hypothetical protein